MHDSLRLGRVAGIPIALNWTTLLLGGLIVLSLGGTAFPQEVPDQVAAAYWTAAVVATVLFYCSLLAHELMHAVVARHQGARVEGITLWLLGGVSRIRDDERTAGQEFRMAIVGPLTSLVACLGFLAAAELVNVMRLPDLVVVVPLWLSGINLMLGLFNLLPAFPLDGGRVLRALLWQRSKKLVAATVTAAKVGRFFGYLLVAVGFLEFFSVDTLGGLWFVFLGWFLLNAATAEAAESLSRSVLAGLTAADVMEEGFAAPDWLSLDTFVESYLLHGHHSSYPVHDSHGAITGVVGLEQMRHVTRSQRDSGHIRDVMVPITKLVRVSPDTPVVEVRDALLEAEEHEALVFRDDELVGVITPADITFATAARSVAHDIPGAVAS